MDRPLSAYLSITVPGIASFLPSTGVPISAVPSTGVTPRSRPYLVPPGSLTSLRALEPAAFHQTSAIIPLSLTGIWLGYLSVEQANTRYDLAAILVRILLSSTQLGRYRPSVGPNGRQHVPTETGFTLRLKAGYIESSPGTRSRAP
ncbi:hypothetical protein MAPG_09083 [Magnaporthiopsis poae ATCC 64411]|uniref:Uncharacterized protein n=1 Tax=Magnaporthiopsis poae (strain ATCC 64411 / 73-15) TaxID=644358 RepID=A0A0C4E907_MAGP6|nr:hypothetical protein MAPG_09083 [Magnaporthiopsis poae ATCC 64411]